MGEQMGFEKIQQFIEAVTTLFSTPFNMIIVPVLAGLIRQLHKHVEHGQPLTLKFIVIGMTISGFVGWNVHLLLPDTYSEGVKTFVAGMGGFFATAILTAFEKAIPTILEGLLKRFGINIEDSKDEK